MHQCLFNCLVRKYTTPKFISVLNFKMASKSFVSLVFFPFAEHIYLQIEHMANEQWYGSNIFFIQNKCIPNRQIDPLGCASEQPSYNIDPTVGLFCSLQKWPYTNRLTFGRVV